MDTIRNYLDSLFIGVPQSTEIDKLKTDCWQIWKTIIMN